MHFSIACTYFSESHSCGCPIAQLHPTLWPHGLQHPRPPCPSPPPGVCSNSCPLSWWCHPTISSSVVPFSSCLQSFPASGSFLITQLFASGGQSIGASVSVLPMKIQDWFPLGLTGLISLRSLLSYCYEKMLLTPTLYCDMLSGLCLVRMDIFLVIWNQLS